MVRHATRSQRRIDQETIVGFTEIQKSISHRHPPHLISRPILPHILRPQLFHLIIQMLPQDRPKAVHDLLQLTHSQLPLATLTLLKILFEHLQPVVYLLMLREELQLFSELRHLLCQNGEDVLFFDGMVDCEVVGELLADIQEGAYRHACWSLTGRCCGV